MAQYREGGWTGDPTLDGYLWGLGAPLNSELLLVEGPGRPGSLLADLMDRAIEHGLSLWRLTDPPHGSYLIVEARPVIKAFLDAIGRRAPPDEWFQFVEALVKESGREPPENAPEEFFQGFFASRMDPRGEQGIVVDWPGTDERIGEALYRQGLDFHVEGEDRYRFPNPENVPGYEMYKTPPGERD